LKIVPRGKEMDTEQLWYNKAMRNIHGGAVWVKDHIYGNNDAGFLVCLEAKSGKVAWQERAAGKGAVLYADGHLYYRVEDGDMLLVEANPAKYVEKGRFTPGLRSKKRAWAHPVIVEGRMYLRDQEYLLCYEVKK
jgi:outer membrane protein assembly factor BamB